MRKPLYPIEEDAQPITVCVTGGTGVAEIQRPAWHVVFSLHSMPLQTLEACLVFHVSVQGAADSSATSLTTAVLQDLMFRMQAT